MGYFRNDPKAWDKGDGAGPVTEADLAVNRLLEDRLRGARPAYGWISEESPPEETGEDAVFIVDPIDGTRAFVAGERTWAHSLAVVENGVPMAAAVYLPMLDRLYSAAIGLGATLNGVPIRASDRGVLDGATLLASRPALAPEHWQGDVPPLTRVFRPSLAYRICLVAEGRYDAMLTIRETWEWDIAAGALIAAEAGAVVSDAEGAPLRFNNPHPTSHGVLAAGTRLHERIAGRLGTEPARNAP